MLFFAQVKKRLCAEDRCELVESEEEECEEKECRPLSRSSSFGAKISNRDRIYLEFLREVERNKESQTTENFHNNALRKVIEILDQLSIFHITKTTHNNDQILA